MEEKSGKGERDRFLLNVDVCVERFHFVGMCVCMRSDVKSVSHEVVMKWWKCYDNVLDI